jgi:hypothetical protein
MARTLLARRKSATDNVPALFRLPPLALCDLHRTRSAPGFFARDSVKLLQRFALTPFHASLVLPPASNAPARHVRRFAFTTGRCDQHSSGDQLRTNKRGGPGVPRTGCNTSGFCEQLIMTNGYHAKLSNRLAKITFLGGVLHRCAVNCRIEQLGLDQQPH